MDRPPITAEGYQKLQDELKHLIKTERPKIINDIAEARAHGDLKENAEYHAAKEKQGFIEGRIQQLNYLLGHAEVIDERSIHSESIQFGATVTYEDVGTGEQTTWKIVGEEESNFKQRKISYKSPIASALMGKEAGDEISIKIPKGNIEVEILSVEYC